MNNTQYKCAKDKLGMKNPDIWCAYFRIAKDTDKSYSSGRLPIPDLLKEGINEVVEDHLKRVLKLKDIISKVFDVDTVSICDSTNDITLELQNLDHTVVFKNNGKDHFLNDVYSFIGPGKINHLILYCPKYPWKKEKKDKNYDWFYWNVNISPRYTHLAVNVIKELLLPK